MEYESVHAGALRLPDLDIVKTFVAVCDAAGFTKASERLSRTQSTISLHIKRLEELYGCQLFVRAKRKVVLTAEGEMLLGYSRRMLQLHTEASSRLRGNQVEGIVRIGIPEDFATYQLPRVLQRFSAIHPGVRLEVRSAMTAELMTALGNSDLDAVVARCGRDEGAGRVIWHEPLVWVCARDFALSREAPLPLIMFPHGCVYRPIILEMLDAAMLPWKISYTSTSLTGVQAAVAAGLGITVLARSTITPAMRSLDSSDFLPRPPITKISVFRRKNHDSSACDALISYIRDSFENPRNLPSGST